jgi:hypothetical protein
MYSSNIMKYKFHNLCEGSKNNSANSFDDNTLTPHLVKNSLAFFSKINTVKKTIQTKKKFFFEELL